MQELMTTASLVEYEALEDGRPLTALLARRELEAALAAGGSAQLWFELGSEGDEETRRLTVELEPTEVKEILGRSSDEQVSLALDGDALGGIFEDPEVEAHGLRGALAIAVTGAAIAAPSGLASVPQTAEAAATVQRATAAATAQQAEAATATTQVSSLAAKVQTAGLASKAQVSKSLVVKANGITLLRRGLAR